MEANIETKNTTRRLWSDLQLLLVALIWGVAFVAQRSSANQVGIFLYTGLRFLLAALVLLPLALRRGNLKRADLGWIFLAGGILFAGSTLQQAGLRLTTAGNAGFITTLYVVFVPLLLVLLFKQRLHPSSWVASGLAVTGLLLLSTSGPLHLAPGDALELLGAVFWALHVIILSRAVQRVDILTLSVGQFLVTAVLNLALGAVFEQNSLVSVQRVGWSLAYTGLLSVAVGYTLQAAGQRYAPPADAALILSLEAVFAGISGYLFLGEMLTGIQALGCALILAASILVQFWHR